MNDLGRMSGAEDTSDDEQSALDVLMSILLLSAEKPDGITKEDILGVLAQYGQVELYGMCEAAAVDDAAQEEAAQEAAQPEEASTDATVTTTTA